MVQNIYSDHRQQVGIRLIRVALRMNAMQQQRFLYVGDIKISADIEIQNASPIVPGRKATYHASAANNADT